MVLRTINKAMEWLKSQDSETCLTEYALRMLLKNDKIKYIMSGNRYYVDLISLKEYLEMN